MKLWLEIVAPALNVVDHWLRYEFQQRGAIHAHGVLWLANQPNIKNLDPLSVEGKEILLKFIKEKFPVVVGNFPDLNISIHRCSVDPSQ